MYLSLNDMNMWDHGPGLDGLGRWGSAKKAMRRLLGKKKKKHAAPAPAPAATSAEPPVSTTTSTSTPTPVTGGSQPVGGTPSPTYVTAPLPMTPQVIYAAGGSGEPSGPGVIDDESAPTTSDATPSSQTSVNVAASTPSAESGGFPWLLLAIPAALIAMKK